MKIPTHSCALVIVHRGDDFRLVHERKHGGSYCFAAGGWIRARRSSKPLNGRRWKNRDYRSSSRVSTRFNTLRQAISVVCALFFAAQPADDALGAMWWELSEIPHLPVRGPKVLKILRESAAGAPVYPLDVRAFE